MNNKMSVLELNVIIYFLVRSSCVGIMVASAIYLAHNNAYLSFLIAPIVGLLPLYIYYKILKKDIKLGWISKIISSLVILALLCILFWNLTTFISTEYLYDTPKLFIGFCFMLPLFYINCRNKQIIGRVGMLLFYVSIALFLLMIVCLLFQVKLDNFLPFMKIRYDKFGMSILSTITYIITPLLLIIDLPVDKENLKFKRILPGYILGCLTIFFCVFMVIGIYGYRLSMILDFPCFQILKRISIGFFERIEHILFFQWMFDIFICESLGISFIKENFKNSKWFNFIICALIYVVSANLFLDNTPILFSYVIPIILFVGVMLFLVIKKEA